MLSSFEAKLRQFILRLPLIGPGLRFFKRIVHMPYMWSEALGRLTALHDQVQALPNLWAPVSEQVWEAQAVASQVMADDLRAALEKSRKENAALLESIDRRLEALERHFETRASRAA
jgi:hypothetical protein